MLGHSCQTIIRRCASSSSSGSHGKAADTSLRRHLARLWLKVHPDLFSQHPDEQSVNEQSFKILQEALRASETHDNTNHMRFEPPGKSKPSELPFYYYSKDSKLEKTSVTLRHGNLGPALSSLFKSLSLPPPPMSVLPQSHFGDSAHRQSKVREGTSLSDIVRHSREAGMSTSQARQNESAEAASRASEWTQRDSNMRRLVLQRTRGISVQLGNGLPRRRRGEFTGLDRLSTVLDCCPDVELAGLRVLIDGGFDCTLISPRATLVLGICASDRQWEASLRSGAVGAAASERRALSALERSAARAVGVAHILFQEGVEDNAILQADYFSYKKLLDDFVRLSDTLSPALANLSLILVGSSSEASQDVTKGAVKGWDNAEGILRVRVSAEFPQILGALTSTGREVAARHEAIRDSAEAERKRVWRVARALRVPDLRRCQGISDAQWSQALDDLIADAGRLGGILDRSPVCIGTESRVLLDTGEIQLAWHFRKSLPL